MEKKYKLPVLPIRDPRIVVFPGLTCVIDVEREISLTAIEVARSSQSNIIIAMQRDETIENPVAKDFFGVCTEAEIKSVVDINDAGTKKRIIVVGKYRARLDQVGKREVPGNKMYLAGKIEPYEEVATQINEEVNDYITSIYKLIEENFGYIIIKNKNPIETNENLSTLIDDIVCQLQIDDRKVKVEFLSEPSTKKRLKALYELLTEEVVRQRTKPQVPSLDGAQTPEEDEFARLNKMVLESGMPEEPMKIATHELRRLKNINPSASEYMVIANYIENLASLPWNKSSEENIDIENSRKVLDRDHYGLEKPKERIIEFLSVKKLSNSKKGAILCLYGPPGTGKTSICKSIAEAIGRKYVRMSLGGVHDESEIRGHRRTYVGAMVGRVIQNIKKSGVNNPLFVLDEVDKLGKDFRGDPSSALLEVLDPEQNNSFVDNYLNVPFDLSNVFFVATVNDLSTIPPALRDRLEIIDVPGYSPFDKVKIAQNHLIPKQKEVNGVSNVEINFSNSALSKVIEEYTAEAGVRSLERECGTIMRKIAVMIASGKEPPSTIRTDSIVKWLGPPKTFSEKIAETPEVGLSAGLAWTQYGGSLLFVECSLSNGKGEVKLTGNLGKVIQESASAVHTWIKVNAETLGIDQELLNTKDVHVHFPAGATPKDGPSAGVAITAAMVSAFKGKPVRNDIAMTGEISLRGRVMPIGGLVEKTMAAHRAGAKEVLFPAQNEHDLDDLPQDVKNNIKLTKIYTLAEAIEKLIINDGTETFNKKISSGGSGQLVNSSCKPK